MNNLKVFKSEEFGQVRTVEINGEPLFIAKDIADALGYRNSREAIRRHVHDEDKGVTKCDTPGGMQEMTTINESGLYSLILSSELPDARKFKRWVTGEVLPAIRKDGGYIASKADETPEELMARALVIANQTIERTKHKINRLEEQTAQQEQIIAELQPKISYYDKILQSSELQPITVIAKDYGMSGLALNRLLNELNIQYKMGDMWLLYRGYAEHGYTQSKTHIVDRDKAVMHTYWTQKGRLFIYEQLKNRKGILPTIERTDVA